MIARAFAKYGVANMKLVILDKNVPLSQLNEMERRRIAEYGTFDPNGMGYNLTPGGEQSPMHVPEVAARSSETHKRQWQDPEHREKMSKAKKTDACKAHYAKMRAVNPRMAEIDYWALPRAEALKRLKANRWGAIDQARRHGRDYDPSWYDQEIPKHEARHVEKYYDMPPRDALKLLKAAFGSMIKFHQRKGTEFKNKWWYEEQMRAHMQRV